MTEISLFNFYKLSKRQNIFYWDNWIPHPPKHRPKNDPKQVVHPNFFLLASSFEIRGGPRSKKTWSQTVLGGGGVCTVTLSGSWSITSRDAGLWMRHWPNVAAMFGWRPWQWANNKPIFGSVCTWWCTHRCRD